ncbi:Protein of unknown function D [Prunus dulcis]|uniref:Like COV 1 n=1 Tax=Prunus dulcis TaxID=3755 RepID=A0A4Y1RX37_PRUDU|nr:Protein of unknown function D [Prunus dulcis]
MVQKRLLALRRENVRVDDVAMACLFNACARLGNVEIGEQGHGFVMKVGLGSSVKACNGVMDMYIKCGLLGMARRVFEEMGERSVVSWTVILDGVVKLEGVGSGGCVILFPIAITFYITWWFIHFVDSFFSPIYAQLGINIFGLGFVTSITFIFIVGVFMSSWLGASVLGLGEWFIKRMPFVRHIYNASKQISSAISPDQNTQAFKEVAIIRHPRIGEYAFGFITSSVVLQSYSGDEELCCVYVPTNHLYIGDVFLVNTKDVIRPNLSVREGIGE